MDSFGAKFLAFSATFVTLQSALQVTGNSDMLAALKMPEAASPAEAAAGLGWGVGKFTALRAGGAAITNFCQLNLLPMGLLWMGAMKGDEADKKALTTAFMACYAYVGFFA